MKVFRHYYIVVNFKLLILLSEDKRINQCIEIVLIVEYGNPVDDSRGNEIWTFYIYNFIRCPHKLSFSPSQAELGKEGKVLFLIMYDNSFSPSQAELGKEGEIIYYFVFTSYRQQLRSRRFLRCRHLFSARRSPADLHWDSDPAQRRAATLPENTSLRMLRSRRCCTGRLQI